VPEPRTLNPEPSRWPHRLALVLCCATFPLVWVGGLVTTYKAGMAFQDWPTSDGHFLFFYPWLDWLQGPWDLFIEHGHRMLGAVIGMLAIVLCVSMWITRQPRYLKVLSVAALAAVIFQGILGGLRVRLDEQTIAKIHGCFGPAFFALTAAIATVTSRRWQTDSRTVDAQPASALATLAIATPLLAYLQLVLGAQLRHFDPSASHAIFRTYVVFHIVVGLALAVHIVVTALCLRRKASQAKALVRPALILVALVLCQIYLGAATWIVTRGVPDFLSFLTDWGWVDSTPIEARSWRQAQITTAHVAVGSLILAVATVLAVRAARMLKLQPLSLTHTVTLKGVAA
jgi:cytochrome c oxidase assembly protein subunit 15